MGQAKPVLTSTVGRGLEQKLRRWMMRAKYFLGALDEEQRRRMPRPGEALTIPVEPSLLPFEERAKRMADIHAESFFHARPSMAEQADEFATLQMAYQIASQILHILPLLPPEVLAAIEEQRVFREDWQVSEHEDDAALLTCILTQHFNAASSGERQSAIIGAKGLRPGASLTALVDPSGNSLFEYAGPQRMPRAS